LNRDKTEKFLDEKTKLCVVTNTRKFST